MVLMSEEKGQQPHKFEMWQDKFGLLKKLNKNCHTVTPIKQSKQFNLIHDLGRVQKSTLTSFFF